MHSKSFTLAELAELTHSKLIGDPSHVIKSVADLESAEAEDASFLAKPLFGQAERYEKAMLKSAAGVIFVHSETKIPEGRNFLINEDPSRAFQETLERFNGSLPDFTGFEGIHPTAVIHPSATVGLHTKIAPLVVVDKEAVIGPRTIIGSGCYIGPGVVIGEDCILHPHVTIRERCKVGDRVILQPGVVVGSCGFGYTTSQKGKHSKLNQVSHVVIEDDVEIGANTTIDRGRFKPTKIGKGTKIDNLVQIGHAAVIGPDNLIVAQTGIAGSAKTGRNVVLAGQCGVTGHVTLSDGVVLSAQSGADKSLPAGKYGGSPAMPMSKNNRTLVHIRNIEKYVKRIEALEKKLEGLS
jgi:UDP-3-O-[3-hydroxymyristoyl] glucosamine N-acyltransferase